MVYTGTLGARRSWSDFESLFTKGTVMPHDGRTNSNGKQRVQRGDSVEVLLYGIRFDSMRYRVDPGDARYGALLNKEVDRPIGIQLKGEIIGGRIVRSGPCRQQVEPISNAESMLT